MGKIARLGAFSACFLILFCFNVSAQIIGDVTLAWDANTEPDLAGYKIYYGVQTRDYPVSIDVGNVTEYTIQGQDVYTVYYYAATAYDTDGNESDFSNEVVYKIDTTSPMPPKNLRQKILQILSKLFNIPLGKLKVIQR